MQELQRLIIIDVGEKDAYTPTPQHLVGVVYRCRCTCACCLLSGVSRRRRGKRDGGIDCACIDVPLKMSESTEVSALVACFRIKKVPALYSPSSFSSSGKEIEKEE